MKILQYKMPVKRLIYSLFFVLFIMLFSACLKELDNKFDETNVTDVSFWKTEEHLKMGVFYLYTFLPGITENNSANWSDDGRGTGSNNISDGSRLVPTSSGDYNNYYSLIRAVNRIINKAEQMQLTDDIKQKYIAEAKYFRAFAYSELVKRFGDVIIIKNVVEANDPLLFSERKARDSVVDLIYEDLDYSAQYLKSARETKIEEYGRINKSVAQALKVSVSLFEGTFAKYHNLKNAEKHLQITKSTAEEIINMDFYKLYNYAADPSKSYYFLFQKEGNGFANKENILSRLYAKDMSNRISTHNYSRNLEQGATTPTRALVDAYLYKDGLPQNGPSRSSLYKPAVSTLTEFEDRDPRLSMTVFKKGDVYINGGTYSPMFSFTQTGYKTYKYFNAEDWVNQASFTEHKIIRYSEILLSYAEAVYELQGSISDVDLEKSINLIRARAGIAKLTNAFVSSNNLDMLEEIRRERRVEFALEGSYRYWDIIRWKIAEKVLPLPTLGIQYFESEYAEKPKVTLSNGFVVAQTAETRKFDASRDYLWPIPSDQISLNPNLKQNPNWIN